MSFTSTREKLFSLERTAGSKKCLKSRCEVCINIEETGTYLSTTTDKNFKINHMLNRDDSCLSFLLICKCYGKQYAVETTD